MVSNFSEVLQEFLDFVYEQILRGVVIFRRSKIFGRSLHSHTIYLDKILKILTPPTLGENELKFLVRLKIGWKSYILKNV